MAMRSRSLSRQDVHGIVDLALIAVLALGPLLLGFQSFSRTVCWIPAILLTAVVALSDSRFGGAHVFDASAHDAAEVAVGVASTLAGIFELQAGRPAVGALLLILAVVLFGSVGAELLHEQRRERELPPGHLHPELGDYPAQPTAT
jgi:hypothetical protein